MQLSLYLYCVRFHPTCFGPPTGPSSGVSRAASSCRHLAHAVLQYDKATIRRHTDIQQHCMSQMAASLCLAFDLHIQCVQAYSDD
jgi:hypothetical protein